MCLLVTHQETTDDLQTTICETSPGVKSYSGTYLFFLSRQFFARAGSDESYVLYASKTCFVTRSILGKDLKNVERMRSPHPERDS